MTDAATPGFADRLLGRARGDATPLRPKLSPFYAPMAETSAPLLDDPVQTDAPVVARIETLPDRVPPPADAAPEAPLRQPAIDHRSAPSRPTTTKPAPLMPDPPAQVPAGPPAAPVPRRATVPAQRAASERVAPPPALPANPVIRAADPVLSPPQPTPALTPRPARPQPDIAAALALALARLTGPTPAPAERLMPPEALPAKAEAPAARNTPRQGEPDPAPVHIHIGEIVVAADPAPALPLPAPHRPDWSPVLTLDAYRASRQRGPR